MGVRRWVFGRARIGVGRVTHRLRAFKNARFVSRSPRRVGRVHRFRRRHAAYRRSDHRRTHDRCAHDRRSDDGHPNDDGTDARRIEFTDGSWIGNRSPARYLGFDRNRGRVLSSSCASRRKRRGDGRACEVGANRSSNEIVPRLKNDTPTIVRQNL